MLYSLTSLISMDAPARAVAKAESQGFLSHCMSEYLFPKRCYVPKLFRIVNE